MQPDIDALHNHITTHHSWYSDRLSYKYGHATQIPNFSIIARKTIKRCCIALCVTVEFNIYVLVTTLLGNNIKVLHNKSFLVCANKYMYNESVGEGN